MFVIPFTNSWLQGHRPLAGTSGDWDTSTRDLGPEFGAGTFGPGRGRRRRTKIGDMTVERELSVAECWQLLRTRAYGRLAVTTSDGPDIFPVNAVVDHGTLVFRTADGSKLAALADDQRVAFEVDGANVDAGFAWSVVVHGRAAVVADRSEVIDAAELGVAPYAAGAKNRIVRITPQGATGRWFAIPGTDAVILDPPVELLQAD